MNKYYYFAYGSNLNHSQMKERCPNAEKLGKAILRGYKFIINTRGVATIVESEDSIVEGGLYKVSADCLASLDYYEGVKYKTYYRKNIEVEFNGEKINAVTYITTDKEEGLTPRRNYIEKIIIGAKEFRLSDEYIKNNFERYLK